MAVHQIIDLLDHRCRPFDGAPDLGKWKWRCPICGQRWIGSSKGAGWGEARGVRGTSIAWKLRDRRRRHNINQARREAAQFVPDAAVQPRSAASGTQIVPDTGLSPVRVSGTPSTGTERAVRATS